MRPLAVHQPLCWAWASPRWLMSLVSWLCRKGLASSPVASMMARWVSGTRTVCWRAACNSAAASPKCRSSWVSPSNAASAETRKLRQVGFMRAPVRVWDIISPVFTCSSVTGKDRPDGLRVPRAPADSFPPADFCPFGGVDRRRLVVGQRADHPARFLHGFPDHLRKQLAQRRESDARGRNRGRAPTVVVAGA